MNNATTLNQNMTTMAESVTQPPTELTASNNLGSDVCKAFGKITCMDAVMRRLRYQSSMSNTRAQLIIIILLL